MNRILWDIKEQKQDDEVDAIWEEMLKGSGAKIEQPKPEIKKREEKAESKT